MNSEANCLRTPIIMDFSRWSIVKGHKSRCRFPKKKNHPQLNPDYRSGGEKRIKTRRLLFRFNSAKLKHKTVPKSPPHRIRITPAFIRLLGARTRSRTLSASARVAHKSCSENFEGAPSTAFWLSAPPEGTSMHHVLIAGDPSGGPARGIPGWAPET